MKMTEELKEMLLKGFEEKLSMLCTCASLTKEYKDSGNEKQSDFWKGEREKHQNSLLKIIGDLIEVEEE